MLLLPPQTFESIWDLASAALCLTYLARATGETGDALAAQILLETAIDLVGGAERLPMSLHRGAAGLAWIPIRLLIAAPRQATESISS